MNATHMATQLVSVASVPLLTHTLTKTSASQNDTWYTCVAHGLTVGQQHDVEKLLQ